MLDIAWLCPPWFTTAPLAKLKHHNVKAGRQRHASQMWRVGLWLWRFLKKLVKTAVLDGGKLPIAIASVLRQIVEKVALRSKT